jgi:carbonic anhydrase
VVGHSQCGGASACLAASSAATDPAELIAVPSHPATDPLNIWLKPLTSLAVSLHLSDKPQAEALRVLVDENVKVQVATVVETEVIQKTWAAKKNVSVHGWVFDIETGLLRDLGISRQSKVGT